MGQVLEWMASVMPAILSTFGGLGGYRKPYHEFWCYLVFFLFTFLLIFLENKIH